MLFGSGATMHYALENWKHGNFMKYAWMMIVTIILGAGFLGGQGYEYTNLIQRARLVGGQRHLRRVVLHAHRHARLPRLHGRLLPDDFAAAVAAGVYTKHKFFGLTAGTLYWHFVDVIWVLLFSIFYLI